MSNDNNSNTPSWSTTQQGTWQQAQSDAQRGLPPQNTTNLPNEVQQNYTNGYYGSK